MVLHWDVLLFLGQREGDAAAGTGCSIKKIGVACDV